VAIALCATAALAQVPTVKIDHGESGRVSLTVQNNSAKELAVVVYTLTFRDPSTGIARTLPPYFMDGFTSSQSSRFIPAHQSNSWVTGVPAPDVEVQVVGGMYADGSTFGDPEIVARLGRRRQYTLDAIEVALEILNDPQASNASADYLLNQFTSAKNSQLSHAVDRDQKAIVGSVNAMLVRNLQSVANAASFLRKDLRNRQALLLAAQPPL